MSKIDRLPMPAEYDLPPPQTHRQLEESIQDQVQEFLDNGGTINKLPIVTRTAADIQRPYTSSAFKSKHKKDAAKRAS